MNYQEPKAFISGNFDLVKEIRFNENDYPYIVLIPKSGGQGVVVYFTKKAGKKINKRTKFNPELFQDKMFVTYFDETLGIERTKVCSKGAEIVDGEEFFS
jgi:hypothetical protein